MSNYYLEASNIFKDNCLILVTFISLAKRQRADRTWGWALKSQGPASVTHFLQKGFNS